MDAAPPGVAQISSTASGASVPSTSSSACISAWTTGCSSAAYPSTAPRSHTSGSEDVLMPLSLHCCHRGHHLATPALVHRRTALPVHRHQLCRSTDAERPGALPEERVHLDQHRLRADRDRLP